MRNYGQLRDTEKPLVVSGILLALKDEKFGTEDLVCDKTQSDGTKIWSAISKTLNDFEVEPSVKKNRLLDQFDFIKNRPYLSQRADKLGKSPLKYFSEYVDSNVITAIVNNSPEDVLGRFYSEFISYSGGDGQSLGVVLTPRHIAELFCDLAQLQPTDKVFDPCCGTATFLIAAMNKMLQLAKTDDEKLSIKKNQLHGIELRDDMFSIATTNMILRGDGKSNLLCDDFLKIDADELREKNFTVGFMNPPYSQAKKKVTSHLSELKFVSHLLDSLGDNARCIVIVPQSAMVGKTTDDKDEKRYILANHTLEGVITLNPQTFYGVGTNPVIAVFTAHKPHDPEHWVKFVDFKNDGYEVFPHIGLLDNGTADERKKLLLQCFIDNRPAPNSFMIRTQIKADDEWLHSFYYFNEEIPTEQDFEKTMADYLTFEFNMIVHGRGYLFNDEKKNSPITENLPPLNNKTWKPFYIKDLFEIFLASGDTQSRNCEPGKFPLISAGTNNNGVCDFIRCGDKKSKIYDGKIISVDMFGQSFFHNYKFYSVSHGRINLLRSLRNFSDDCLKFIVVVINKTTHGKFFYNQMCSSQRIKNLKINLPINELGEPDYLYMENYMRRIEENLLKIYLNYITPPKVDDEVIVPLDKKVWKPFSINEIFIIKSGVRLTKKDMRAGEIPFIGALDNNNGIVDFISNKNSSLDKNVLGVNYDGNGMVMSFYHQYEALFSDSVKRFHLKNHADDKYILLFIKNSILQQKIKFQYGYKFNAGRMARQKILLPVDEKNLPDWEYMEKYMIAQENLLLKKYFDNRLCEI